MKTNIFAIALFAILFCSCKEDAIGPMDNNQNPPGKITNIRVENQPGKVLLTYNLPTDPDLLYAKAVYKLNSGVTREIKASYYTNQMLLDGFNSTAIQSVQVYAVNRSEVASAPETVEVKPLENPIWDVRRSIVVSDDFSGFNVKANNEAREVASIEMMVLDSLGVWQNVGSFETKNLKFDASYRGLDTLEYQCRFTVRDRFLNYTDTLQQTVHPLFEMKLDKKLWQAHNLPNDVKGEQTWLPMDKMWDNNYNHEDAHRWLTIDGTTPDGAWSTFDLGVAAILSRLVVFNWSNDAFGGTYRTFYYGEHMREFEVWGSNNPASDGSWASWTLLGEFENIKPSGLPYREQTKEDFDAAVKGFEYTFPVDNAQKVRYVRIKNIRNWEGTTRFGIAEIDLYGDPRPDKQ